MLFLFISFVAGLLTVLAPCVLPLLPVVIGGSLSGEGVNRKKALTIVIALGISVILFTFILKVSTSFISIPESVWMWISGTILTLFGLITLFPSLWDNLKFAARINQKSNKILGVGYQKKSFWGDIIIGASLGPVFSSCSPTYFIVLATVLPASFFLGTIYLVSYTVGLCLALFVISLVGQNILNKIGDMADPKGWIKKVLGILFILVGLAVITGVDKQVEASLLLNAGVFDITQVEQKFLKLNEKPALTIPPVTSPQSATPTEIPVTSLKATKSVAPETQEQIQKDIQLKQIQYPLAPELVSPDGYINTGGKPITLASLRGRVVLLDIWTYSCINCQRTLPYIKDWYAKYKDQGLEIIGVHTPEFAFEKVLKNVEDAVARFGIKYPVILDSEYKTWNAYGNQYWPRKYLIDIDGFVVYDHIGEGNYDETEKAIQKALLERSKRLGTEVKMGDVTESPAGEINSTLSKIASPETYFGSARNEYLANGNSGVSGLQTFTLPQSVASNKLYLGGKWNIQDEFAQNFGGGEILFKYNSKNVYMVASSDVGADIEIWQDGKLLNTVHIKENRLYTLIEGKDYSQHILDIKIKSPGIKAFTFTFG
ncbi:MAG: cytochrome c biogenesis protein DipZ [Candidatus Pacebacteria bacterium]|nr:cytochrome c biogenesis protein DipZ [Candidatus Paceibacterota bacterium]